MLFIHTSFSQACGIYRIKYVGKIESKTHKIKKIKLPSIMFLHNAVDRNENVAFIEVDINGDEINKETASHLTSHLSDFLESMIAYAEDIQGYYDNMKMNIDADEASWENFSKILEGARVYE